MRKTVIALAAAAVLTAGSTMAALAHGGGHGGGGGGGGHGGGYGGHMGGGFGHAAFGHAAFGHPAFGHPGSFGGAHFHGNRFAFRHHRFFAFTGAGYYPYYAYDDSCRVWTPRGWRWVCNY